MSIQSLIHEWNKKIPEWLNKQRFNSADVTKQGKSQLSEESRKSGYNTHDIKDSSNIT